MSGVPHSVVWESTNFAQKVSSWMSYKPSRDIETSHETPEGATAGRASIVAPSQHTDPNEGLLGKRIKGQHQMSYSRTILTEGMLGAA